MHLKEIEREALAFRAATMNNRPGILTTGSAWVVKMLKRLSLSLSVMSTRDDPNIEPSP
jgi:hypothetical protein